MKRTLLKIAPPLLALALCLSSCWGIDLSMRYYKRPSYVTAWYKVNSLGIESLEAREVNGIPYNMICIKPGDYSILSTLNTKFSDDDGKYDYYCSQHNDTNYKSIKISSEEILYHSYPADDFTGFSLTAVNDWDSDHPAGSSLGDISWYVGFTIAPFIASGYKECDYSQLELSPYFVLRWGNRVDKYCKYPVDKPFNELNQEDLSLCDGDPGLRLFDMFVQSPENEATLRLTATTLSGRTFDLEITCYPAGADIPQSVD